MGQVEIFEMPFISDPDPHVGQVSVMSVVVASGRRVQQYGRPVVRRAVPFCPVFATGSDESAPSLGQCATIMNKLLPKYHNNINSAPPHTTLRRVPGCILTPGFDPARLCAGFLRFHTVSRFPGIDVIR